MRFDTSFFKLALIALVIPGPYSSSVNSFLISSMQYTYMAPPGLLSASLSFLVPRISIEASTRSVINASTASWSPSMGEGIVSSFLGFPTTAWKASSPSQSVPMTEWPRLTASIIVFSGRKSAAPSIISTASLVPATMRLRRLAAICSLVGLMMNVSSINPTCTWATDFMRGTSDMNMAALAAVAPSASRPRFPSYDSTQFNSCVSCFHPSQISGLNGLSIIRLTKISCSAGAPSRFLNPPDVMPALENRS